MIINKLYENIVVYLGFPRSIIVVYSEPCDAEMLFYLFVTEGLYILGFFVNDTDDRIQGVEAL